jgi:hypothetical protein
VRTTCDETRRNTRPQRLNVIKEASAPLGERRRQTLQPARDERQWLNRYGPDHEAQLERPKCAFSYWPFPGCLASPPRRRMLLRRVQTSDRSGRAPRPALSRWGVAAARVGTPCLVIGANGGADGFRRTVRRTGITAAKVHTREGEVLTTEAGVRPGVGTARMGAEAITAADGAIPSVSPGHDCSCSMRSDSSRARYQSGRYTRRQPSQS